MRPGIIRPKVSYWENDRATDDVSVVNTEIAVLPLNLAKAVGAKVDLMINNTPANSRDIAAEAARAADFVLIPAVPRAFDVASVLQTVKQIKQEGTPFAVVLSQVKQPAARPTTPPPLSSGWVSSCWRPAFTTARISATRSGWGRRPPNTIRRARPPPSCGPRLMKLSD